jgi:hypothetical protein
MGLALALALLRNLRTDQMTLHHIFGQFYDIKQFAECSPPYATYDAGKQKKQHGHPSFQKSGLLTHIQL